MSCVFCFMGLLIVSKISGVCLFWSVVPFFSSRLAVSLTCTPMCEGTHWKATVLPCQFSSFIVLLASFTVTICTICITWKYVTTQQVTVTNYTHIPHKLSLIIHIQVSHRVGYISQSMQVEMKWQQYWSDKVMSLYIPNYLSTSKPWIANIPWSYLNK